MTIPSASIQSQAAKLSAKKTKACRLFNECRQYSLTLPQRVTIHTNGNPNAPLRKPEDVWAHNTAEEMRDFGRLSETAILLEELDGRPREVCHLHSLARAASYKGGKINNVNNLAVLLRETNQMINKRCISRANAEVLDRMILAGNYLAARVFASAVCF